MPLVISLNRLRAQQEDPLKTISQMLTSTSCCYYHSGCWPAERQRDREAIIYLLGRADVQNDRHPEWDLYERNNLLPPRLR